MAHPLFEEADLADLAPGSIVSVMRNEGTIEEGMVEEILSSGFVRVRFARLEVVDFSSLMLVSLTPLLASTEDVLELMKSLVPV
jgi:hypothetical protein